MDSVHITCTYDRNVCMQKIESSFWLNADKLCTNVVEQESISALSRRLNSVNENTRCRCAGTYRCRCHGNCCSCCYIATMTTASFPTNLGISFSLRSLSVTSWWLHCLWFARFRWCYRGTPRLGQFLSLFNWWCIVWLNIRFKTYHKQLTNFHWLLPHSLPSAGPRADPSVQAVSPQVTKIIPRR